MTGNDVNNDISHSQQISVVMDSEIDTKATVLSRVHPSLKPRFFAAISDGFGSSVR